MMPITSSTDQTLAMRMAEGRLPLGDALRVAMQVGESLRRLHDSGDLHGAVTPSNITLTHEGAVLIPAPEDSAGMADAHGDIFSFGALLYEMLTGQAFESGAVSSGSPAADRVLGLCLSPNLDSRPVRMRTILMELRLLGVAARRAEIAAAIASRRDVLVNIGELRAEMRVMEERFEARLAAQEVTAAETQRSTIEAVAFLQEQIDGLRGELAGAQESMKSQLASIEGARTAIAQMDDVVDRVVEALEALQNVVLDPAGTSPGGSSLAAN